MKVKMVLLKDWEEFKAGDIVEVDAETGMELLQSKTAEMARQKSPEEPENTSADDNAPVDEKAMSREEAADMISKAVTEAIGQMAGELQKSPAFHTQAAVADKPYKSLGEQLQDVRAVHTNGPDAGKARERLEKSFDAAEKAASGMNELVDAEGGFLVQSDFVQKLESRAMDTGILVSKTTIRDVSGNGLKWNDLDDYNRTDGNRPVTVYWTAEAADITDSHPTIKRMEMQVEKLAGLYYATDELLEDAVALEGEVNDWFGREFGYKLDDSILRGTGAGAPLGILNANCLVTQAKETGQTAATINDENITNMFARMPSMLQSGAEWYINQDAWPQLPRMTVGDQPVFMPPNNLIDAPAGTLLGKRINMIEQASTLGTVGDIMYANLKEYKMIRKGGMKAASSIHVRFVQDETAFRFTMRVNGQPSWRTYRTPAQGSNTLSPFVVLATRS